ncbi:hypothetical protein FisN_10Hh013 [Fistulifera solaris]|uniref:Uncharacterized protein n=1 Tax=Fistulifera solaris TaxID=1519565 RepID=A0A1Z5K5G5_FISSO|nr:hypothetical protein FisN_10Hh013 [Fistulifera solaris]|eukprot:GAX21435.1 hypothetical protein FisN_10Hh013 [Fistulifera solaris]
MMRKLVLLMAAALIGDGDAFTPILKQGYGSRKMSSTLLAETSQAAAAVSPKEAVKIFGRLAEKYIMLDSSAGMCCYSACADCEFRLPGGGYRMADQSAARPKWIPSYETRQANGKEHSTKWSTKIFTEGPAVSMEEFVEKIQQIEYVPPLGGPYVGASSAAFDNDQALQSFFEILSNGKEKLTRHRMSQRLKELADGEEGLTWAAFSKAFDL